MPDRRAGHGLVAAGAALVWRRQRVLWWVYAVNLALGLMGTAGARSGAPGAVVPASTWRYWLSRRFKTSATELPWSAGASASSALAGAVPALVSLCPSVAGVSCSVERTAAWAGSKESKTSAAEGGGRRLAHAVPWLERECCAS